MTCKHCGSTNTRVKDRKNNRWFCKDCAKTFRPNSNEPPKPEKLGMSLTEFTKKYDKEYILTTTLRKVMVNLKPDTIYERADIIKLTGLGNSYPGMATALESYADQYGKANSKVFFSHADTIAELKRMAKLS